jgi:predicted dehydrogenase
MTSPSCTVAIVGAGGMARQHIRAFQDIPGVRVAGIHSRTASRAEALASELGVPAVCGSIAELYETTAADLVVVAVPELAVREACALCFEHPWTLLVEKPAGYNVADAEAIVAAADAKGRRAYVALNRRHLGSTRAVLADLSSLGGKRLIKIQDQESPAAALQAGQPPLVVENWMYANSIHLIDLFAVFGRGQIVEVVPVIRWNPAEPGYVAARISYDSGDVGLYEAVWNAPGPWAVTVTTPEKRWEMRPVEKAAYQLAGTRVLEPASDDPWDTAFKPGLRRQAELAVRAATGDAAGLPTLRDALASMRLTQSIYSQE